MKKIIFTVPARAELRHIDRDTAMRILTTFHRFAETGEGDIKKMQGDPGELRLRVGDYASASRKNPRTLSTSTR